MGVKSPEEFQSTNLYMNVESSVSSEFLRQKQHVWSCALAAAHQENHVRLNVPLSSLSTFKVGGAALLYVMISSCEQLAATVTCARLEGIPYFILGNGSNCLFPDEGLYGVVLHNKIEDVYEEGMCLRVGSGAQISAIGVKTAKDGFGGLEFAAGVPGTVGGAVFMNAGCMGQQTGDAVVMVDLLDEQGQRKQLEKKELGYGYRSSIFQKKDWIILSAVFQLYEDRSARERQKMMMEYRRKTQPYQMPSAGCVFRNPENMSAGYLIEKSGLKGMMIGGACVSPIHANFIVNMGEATAKDISQLIQKVQETVLSVTGILLHSEIRIIV